MMTGKTCATAIMLFIFAGVFVLNAAVHQDNPLQLLNSYLKDAKNLSFSADVYEGTGKIKNFRLKFSEGVAGIFNLYRTGLKVKKADIEALDIKLKRGASNNVDMQASSIGSIYLRSLEITESDMTALAAAVYKKFSHVSVKIDNGRIILRARYSGMNFEAAALVYKPENGVRDIGVRFDGLKAGKVKVPRKLAGLLMRGDHLLLKKLKINTKLYYNDISAQGGVLKIR